MHSIKEQNWCLMTRGEKEVEEGLQVHFKVMLAVIYTLPVVPNSSNLTTFQEQLGPHLQEVFGGMFQI